MAKIWWFIRRKKHVGALVATYVRGDLLVLRSSYRSAWNFPGGGVKRFESPEQAARREFQEETGMIVPLLKPTGHVQGLFECRRDDVHFFELHLDEMPPFKIDNREIVEARLVSPGELAKLQFTGPVAAYLRGEALPETPGRVEPDAKALPARKPQGLL